MTPLEALIRKRIAAEGPLPFADYMALCLYHPQHGYYMARDPVGTEGDFITSPEISQIFGEMVALWCMDMWVKMGRPAPFTLLECGPGHGTCMQDVLRGARALPDFLSTAQVMLLEVSPVLREKQRHALATHKVVWIADIAELPAQPVIMFCNEFFDAFPVARHAKTEQGWQEQKVTLKENRLALEPDASIMRESSPAILAWLERFLPKLMTSGGAALIIDYAHDGLRPVDSVQAMARHTHADILARPGETDLTAYVDYGAIIVKAEEYGVRAHGVLSQRDFLRHYGLQERLLQLKRHANSEQQGALDSGAARLIESGGMGTLFRVLCLAQAALPAPHGFS